MYIHWQVFAVMWLEIGLPKAFKCWHPGGACKHHPMCDLNVASYSHTLWCDDVARLHSDCRGVIQKMCSFKCWSLPLIMCREFCCLAERCIFHIRILWRTLSLWWWAKSRLWRCQLHWTCYMQTPRWLPRLLLWRRMEWKWVRELQRQVTTVHTLLLLIFKFGVYHFWLPTLHEVIAVLVRGN